MPGDERSLAGTDTAVPLVNSVPDRCSRSLGIAFEAPWLVSSMADSGELDFATQLYFEEADEPGLCELLPPNFREGSKGLR